MGKVRELFLGFLLLLLTTSAKVNSQTVPFVEPSDGRAPIVAALNQANLSLDFYIFRLTLPANDPILDSIRAAVARGVIVRALLEPCPGDEADVCAPPNADARGACELLTQNGAAVKWANPAFTKTHAKSVLIDNVRTLILTLNLVPQTFTAKRDYGVLTDDLGVADDLARVFAQDWFAQDPFNADIITDCSLPPARNLDSTLDIYPALMITPDNARDQMIGTAAIPGLILSAQAPGFLKIQMEKIDPPNSSRDTPRNRGQDKQRRSGSSPAKTSYTK
jgi:phosphatidylserine/phosphatidylglycerophosphate/cardiolipin synthase-like enzyme